MNHYTKCRGTLVLLALAATLIGTHAGIIPKPAEMKTGQGKFTLNPQARIEIEENNPAARDAADYLATTLRRSTGYALKISETTGSKGTPNTILITSATVEAAFDGYTDYQVWDKYSEQQSSLVSLIAGQAYYLEALHKEGIGGDQF